MLNYDPEGPAYTVSIGHLIWSAEMDLVWDLRLIHNKLMWEERIGQTELEREQVVTNNL